MSSNTNIGNTPVNQGYVQLIHTGETGGIDGTLRTLYDGDGTASDLQIASNKVKISTQLYIGSDTLQEYIQDTVGAMLVTNASHTNLSAAYDDAGDGAIDLTASGDVTLTNTVTLSNKTLAAPTLTGTTQGASITLSGDLTVNGTTTTVNQTNLDVSDNIIGLNRGAGSNANDSGLIIERGSTGDNAAIIWDESADKFTLGTTTSTPSATGDLTISTGTLVAALEGNADTATKIASITNSDIVQLTSSQTLTNKTLASPTFTGDIDFSDASTPQLNITDTTNTITTRVASSDTNGTVGTVTAHNLNIIRNSVAHFNLFGAYTMHNNGGNDLDFRAKDSSGNVVFKVDAGDSKTHITTLKLDSVSISAIQTGSESFADNDTSLMTSAAIQDKILSYGYTTTGAITALNNATENELVTVGSTTTELDAEANLTFDASSNLDLLSDSGKLRIGANNELELYHNGTNDFIDSGGTAFFIRQGTTEKIKFNSAGNIQFNNAQADINTRFGTTGSTNTLFIDGGTDKVGIGTNSPEGKVHIYNGDASVAPDGDADELVVENSSRSGISILSGEGSTDTGAVIFGSANDAFGAGLQYSYHGNSLKLMTANTGHSLIFSTDNNSEAMRINSSGNVGIGTTSPSFGLQIDGSNFSGDSLKITRGTSEFYVLNANNSYGVLGMSSNHDLQIRTNATTRMTIDNAGLVGIGNTSPDATFHVGDNSSSFTLGTTSGNSIDLLKLETDSANANQLIFSSERVSDGSTWTSTRERIRRRVDTSNMGYIQFGSSFDATNAHMISFGEVGVGDYMGITGDGKIGIGTSTPSSKLQVAGDLKLSIAQDNYIFEAENSTEPAFKYRIYNDGSSSTNAVTFKAGLFYNTTENSTIRYYRGSDGATGYLGFVTNGNERMSINTSGNVGIGTTSPGALLDVGGDADEFALIGRARVGYNSHSDYASFQHRDSATSGGYALLQQNNGATYLNAASGQPIYFRINNSDVMHINSSGNVGIGTTTPATKLHLMSGDLFLTANSTSADSGQGIFWQSTTSGWNTGQALGAIYGKRVDASNGYLRFDTRSSGTTAERMRLINTGALHVINDVVAFSSTPSDQKLKENVKDIEYGLDTIMKLNPKQYDWKKDNRHDIGFIAQEVEQVIPEIVKENEWFDDKIKTMDYEKLTAVLIKAVQEQQQQINKLKEQLNG